MLTSWIVSVDLPAGQGPHRPRSATLALRRARRGVPVRVAPGSEDEVAGRDRRRVDPHDLESGHAKGGVPGGGDGIGPRETESGHGIGPRTKADPWAWALTRNQPVVLARNQPPRRSRSRGRSRTTFAVGPGAPHDDARGLRCGCRAGSPRGSRGRAGAANKVARRGSYTSPGRGRPSVAVDVAGRV